VERLANAPTLQKQRPRVAEGTTVAKKPGNAGGARGPQLGQASKAKPWFGWKGD
jgi:hypothetical protein